MNDNAPAVLIVEDEPLIAMMLEDFLDSLGYRVIATVDRVADALRVVESDRFDAVILDVHLRGNEPSWPVADALAERSTPFLLATGGSNDTQPPRHQDVPTLSKPFTMDGIRVAMERLLGTPRSPAG